MNDSPDLTYEYNERAAIHEFLGGADRKTAERMAWREVYGTEPECTTTTNSTQKLPRGCANSSEPDLFRPAKSMKGAL